MAKAKTYTCKNCDTQSTKIGVASICTQRLSIPDDNWDDLEVGDTLHGYCLECGTRIPAAVLKRILGHEAKPRL